MDEKGFVRILKCAVDNKVSDIHLSVGEVPGLRLHGTIVDLKHPPLTADDMLAIAHALSGTLSSEGKTMGGTSLDQIKDRDGSYEVPGLGRFRYNIFSSLKGLSAVLRTIPNQVYSIDQMGLPGVLKAIAGSKRGLVLVTGATGSGKSTTLAALVHHINETMADHIVSIEDPIEFVHVKKKARISQREIGRNTSSFAAALRSALRQDPDVIFVGEMRDTETVDIALKAAETGHLVLSTVHTTDAAKTVGRLISMFPAEQQQMVRLRLADNLRATISQRLLKKKDGKGRVAALEVMLNTKNIADCISDPKLTDQLNQYIEQGRETTGSQTFDQHIAELYLKGFIDLETAKEAATSASDLERNLMYGKGQGDAAAGGHEKLDSLSQVDVTLEKAS